MDSRESIEAEIQSLRQRRGAALLAGQTFNDTAIAALNQKLEALADVETAKAEQAREDAAKRATAEVRAAQMEIEDLKAASTKALSESRAAYHLGATTMRTHLETEASLRKAATRAKALGVTVAGVENEFELERKRSLQNRVSRTQTYQQSPEQIRQSYLADGSRRLEVERTAHYAERKHCCC